VIRGEEWLPSACKHVLLYHAFNTIASIREEPPVKMPKWAHLPLLLNGEGGKLSKRHSHGSVSSLRAALYEPQAVVNFVASLGFTFASDNEILSLPALAAQFDLSRVHAGGAQVCVCVCVCVRALVLLFITHIHTIGEHREAEQPTSNRGAEQVYSPTPRGAIARVDFLVCAPRFGRRRER
jgi:hypothetical protein